MSSKNLAGWLLIISPIATLIVFAWLYEAFIGDGETAAESVALLTKNVTVSTIIILLGTLSFVAQPAGFILVTNAMREGNKPGAGVASLASRLFTAIAVIVILGNGVELGVLGVEDTAAAVRVYEVGEVFWEPIGYFFPLAILLLGIGITIQKNVHVVIGWLFVVLGVIVFLTGLFNIDNDALGFVQWIGFTVLTVVLGVLVLYKDCKYHKE